MFAVRVEFLCSLGWVSEVDYVIEQPRSSILAHFPRMERPLRRTNVMRTHT